MEFNRFQNDKENRDVLGKGKDSYGTRARQHLKGIRDQEIITLG